MTRSGNVDEPTREYPDFSAGRAVAAPPAEPAGPVPDGPEPAAAATEAPRRGRGRLWLLVALGVALALVLGGVRAVTNWPGFDNPFAREQVDRSQPALLKSMRDLSRYVAAEGNFQVVIDLQDKRENVPAFLLSQRTLFVAAGSVDAYVDFAALSDGAIVASADNRTVTVNLPAPRLDDAQLDLAKSYVFAEQSGMLNKLGELFGGNPNDQREIYLEAQKRITAAAADSGLAQRAQENTGKMIEGLLRSLGYTTVTVKFAAP